MTVAAGRLEDSRRFCPTDINTDVRRFVDENLGGLASGGGGGFFQYQIGPCGSTDGRTDGRTDGMCVTCSLPRTSHFKRAPDNIVLINSNWPFCPVRPAINTI